jgi:hypothetical protein
MKWDIFFATEMYRNFFEQVEAADRLGFGVAWIAESHLSSEVQKGNSHPVIPHWKGEVGLNVDFLQLSHQIFRRTRHIETGSAVMNILCNGGPIAAAERVAAFLGLHGLDPEERRRIHVGFAAGRFDFMNRASGIVARDAVEEAAWPALKGKIFAEASEIFLRLLRGDVLRSDQVRTTSLRRADFRSDEDWARVLEAAGRSGEPHGKVTLEIPRRWSFEDLKIIPQDWRRELLQLIIGSHDPRLQEEVNEILPVQVFNLSITRPEIVEDTHRRMAVAYHPDGGEWSRSFMPRTTFVFLNEQFGLPPERHREAARKEAREALSAYWTALEGTLDPLKVENAAENALVGNAEDVADQILERFHRDDRLMLWFDFFNHDCDRVLSNMEDFMGKVRPLVEKGLES